MYDLVIIGGGAGGLAAAIYALRARLNVVLLESLGIGGQIAVSDVIENYPGFRSLSGAELMRKFEEHAKDFGLITKYTEVQAISSKENVKVVKTDSGEIECSAIIIATGAEPKKLGTPGEIKFTGKGVSYCATCDGPFFRDKEVIVVGGGDTAVKDALFLTKLVKKVFLVHRRDMLRAEKILQEMILKHPKVEFCWNSVVETISGDSSGMTGASIKNRETGVVREIQSEGIFIFVGINPNAGFTNVSKDEGGFIKVNDRMETSEEGIFAIGDVRVTPLRQVATAVGDGAIAAVMAEEYISMQKGSSYPSRS